MSSANLLTKFKHWLNPEDEEEEFEEMAPANVPPQPQSPSRRQRGQLVLHGGSEGGIEIRHPLTLEDRHTVGTDLKQRRMVTLDLTRLPDADARYFLEFVYGVVFALDATAEKVTEGIYLLVPPGVAVHNQDGEQPETDAAQYGSQASGAGRREQEELFWQAR